MILVTGATGFIGAHLTLHLLEKGKQVRAIFRNLKSQEFTKSVFAQYDKAHLFEKIQWQQADLLDIPALELAFSDIEQVYHCAAFISHNPSDEPLMRKVNIEGTANMVNLSLHFNIKKFGHLSSVAALGDAIYQNQIIDETTDWNPEKFHSDYAITKYGGEMEVWRAQQEGLNVVVICPPVVLGPIPDLDQNQQGSSQIFRTIKNGFPFYTKGSNAFIAVSDVVEIFTQLMESDIKNERLIIIGEHLPLKSVATYISNAYQVKPPHIQVNQFLLKTALILDQIGSWFGKKRNLYQQSVPSLFKQSRYSDDKFQKKLPFIYTPIEAYIKDSIGIMNKTN